jgi:hypothetical protein
MYIGQRTLKMAHWEVNAVSVVNLVGVATELKTQMRHRDVAPSHYAY